MKRDLPARGRIVGTDGTVWATDIDGVRSYPQEWLAGQAIGYVSPVTKDDLAKLAAKGYLAGDVVGPLRARVWSRGPAARHARLDAVGGGGERAPATVLHTDAVPGAELAITLRPGLQATAERGLAGSQQRRHRRRRPAERRGVGARIGPRLQPERDDPWQHARRRGTRHSDRLPRSSTRPCWARTRPARRSSPSRSAAALKTGVAGPGTRVVVPGHVELQRLHVPQLQGPHPRQQRLAAPGHGLQLQHDLHAALDPGLRRSRRRR